MVGTAQAAVYIGGSPTTAVSVPAAYNFKPWVSAPANSKLTFSVAGKPYWATFNTTNGALSGKVYAANIGTYSGIRISVTDGKSKASTAAFAIKVATGTTTTPPTTANLQLSSSSYTVAQSAGALTVTVQRTGATNTAVSTAFATANGSAVAGTDYTSASGTLNWASGDTSAKSFSVPVRNTTPFVGSKSFTVALASPSTGAQIATPGSAGVTINGSGAAGGGGSSSGSGTAPSALTITSQSANSISLSWGGVSGATSYKIYRNGSSYATSSSTNYTDSRAYTATVPTYDGPANLYTYAVSAVDSSGKESAQTTDTTYWVYNKGVFNWEGDYSYGGASINYNDTAGGPQSGPFDIGVTVTSAGSGFQPYAGKTVPTYDLEAGAFNYMQLDIKPTLANQTFTMSMISRVPPGDVFPSVSAKVQDYGPAMTAGKWATYKIPLSVFHVGKTGFVGSISGSKLTVTSASQMVIDAGGFIVGPGVKAGTYVTAVGSGTTGGVGTYTVVPSQTVGSASMSYQRTHLYKFDLMDQRGGSSNKYYVDNIKFTTK